jgi:hypothetical protein
MPIAPCLFCGEVKPLGLFFRVCVTCWEAESDPFARLDRVIEERGLVAPAGSLVYRPCQP